LTLDKNATELFIFFELNHFLLATETCCYQLINFIIVNSKKAFQHQYVLC